MKKAVSIFLLSIFLFNTVGYYLVFTTAHSELKKEMKRELKLRLNSDELTMISFSLSEIKDIHWIKKEKEFIYHDQMFDIVKTSGDSSSITYHCINDKQEKKLFEHLEEHVSKQLENNKNSKSKNVVKTDYFEESPMVLFREVSSQDFLPYNKLYSSVETAITVPPPRI